MKTVQTPFKVGDRVELHPACDLWMRGARFGTITKITKTFVWVKLDKAARPLRFRADLVQPID